ncbi:cytosine deaminase [Luminiphilus syltensis NOR5-1B]|uniref:Cytosine deaminase n=1 Tax=Luminiphilus syltensis NOR5-1B TaxID=565045 RepID=B8KWV0_9GAMM|nr:nucleoside deaminase [Luminiphilus syltensis]EED36517.1 cytosine deaminase [Luminiphilus syltensis NOR5-1B]
MRKRFREGGCPIGAVIVDRVTREIVGKGHNTLVQENYPYNHRETAAIREAGHIDFSRCVLVTTLSPCDICARLIIMRQFPHPIVGDVTNAKGNEQLLRDHGIQADVPDYAVGIALYQHENPDLEREDWLGLGAHQSQ